MPEDKSVIDPYRPYRFRITIAEGGIIGHFIKCDGIKIVTERLIYPLGGPDGRLIQLPGKTHYFPVTLYNGVISNDSLGLWSWMERTRKFQRDKRSVMLDYLGPEPNDVHGFVLEEAWICSWKGGEMNGMARDFAVEEIGIAYDSVSRGKA
jgi:phage tail-like protein